MFFLKKEYWLYGGMGLEELTGNIKEYKELTGS